jgi:hypothetical protein
MYTGVDIIFNLNCQYHSSALRILLYYPDKGFSLKTLKSSPYIFPC